MFHAESLRQLGELLVDAGVLTVAPGRDAWASTEKTLEDLAGCLAFVLPVGVKLTLQNLAGAVTAPPSGSLDRRIGAGEPGVRRSSLESEHSRAE